MSLYCIYIPYSQSLSSPPIMGCGMSSTLDPPEDAITLSRHRKIVRLVTPATTFRSRDNDSVCSSAQQSHYNTAVQEPEAERAKLVIRDEPKENKEGGDDVVFLPRSPSFKDYCIHSSESRDQSFSDHYNDVAVDSEDSAKADLRVKENKAGEVRSFLCLLIISPSILKIFKRSPKIFIFVQHIPSILLTQTKVRFG